MAMLTEAMLKQIENNELYNIICISALDPSVTQARINIAFYRNTKIYKVKIDGMSEQNTTFFFQGPSLNPKRQSQIETIEFVNTPGSTLSSLEYFPPATNTLKFKCDSKTTLDGDQNIKINIRQPNSISHLCLNGIDEQLANSIAKCPNLPLLKYIKLKNLYYGTNR